MNITILGTGFVAMTAIKQIRKRTPESNTIVITPQKKVYLPSIVWIPSGLKKGSYLIVNLENFFRKQKVKFL